MTLEEEKMDKQIQLLKLLVKTNQSQKEAELEQEIDPYEQLDALPKEAIARTEQEQSELLKYDQSYTQSYTQSIPYSIENTSQDDISVRSIKSSAENNPPKNSIFKWSLYKQFALNTTDKITAFYTTTNYIAIGINSSSYILRIYKKNVSVEFVSEFGKITCIHILKTQLIAGYEKGHITVYDLNTMLLLKLIPPVDETEMISTRPPLNGIKNNTAHKLHTSISSVSIPFKNHYFSADTSGNAFFHTLKYNLLYNQITSIKIHGATEQSYIMGFEGCPVNEKYPYYLMAMSTRNKLAIMAMRPTPQILFKLYWADLHPDITTRVYPHVETNEKSSPKSKTFHQENESLSDLQKTKTLYEKDIESNLAWFIPPSSSTIYLSYTYGPTIQILQILKTKKLEFELFSKHKFDSDIILLKFINNSIICVTRDFMLFVLDINLYVVESENVKWWIKEFGDLHIYDESVQKYFKYYVNTGLSNRNSLGLERLFLLTASGVLSGSVYGWKQRFKMMEFDKMCEEVRGFYFGEVNMFCRPFEDVRDEIKSFFKTEIKGQVMKTFDEIKVMEEYGIVGDALDYSELFMKVLIDLSLEDFIFKDLYDLYKKDSKYYQTLVKFVYNNQIKKLPQHILFEIAYIANIDFEQIILYLTPTDYDTTKLLNLTRERGYTTALIYVYNELGDFRSPILEILNFRNGDVMKNYYFLMCYISYAVQGRRFPIGGEVDGSAVLDVLFSENYLDFQMDSSALNEGAIVKVEINTLPWPYFYYLLEVDTKEMINLLYTIFDSKRINHSIVVRAIFKLLEIRIWTEIQQDLIYSFLARMHKKHQIEVTTSELDSLFNWILKSEVNETKSERENAILDLFTSGFVPKQKPVKLITRFEEISFWKCYEYQAILDNQYGLALNSYLKTPIRIKDVFDQMNNWIISGVSKDMILKNIKANLEGYMFSGSLLPKFINQNYQKEHLELVQSLSDDLRFGYLDSLLNTTPIVAGFGSELYHIYLMLFCKKNPIKVKRFLERVEEDLDVLPYKPAVVIDLLSTEELADVKIWLLMKIGEYEEAFEMSLPLLLIKDKNDVMEKHLQTTISILRESKDAKLWDTFLERFCFKNSTDPTFVKLRTIAMDSIYTQYPTKTIIQKFFETNHGEIQICKKFLKELISQYGIQSSKIISTLKLSSEDQYIQSKDYVEKLSKSLGPKRGQCEICKKVMHLKIMTIKEQNMDLVVFNCKHVYHSNCLSKEIQRRGGVGSDPWCVMCSKPVVDPKGKSIGFANVKLKTLDLSDAEIPFEDLNEDIESVYARVAQNTVEIVDVNPGFQFLDEINFNESLMNLE